MENTNKEAQAVYRIGMYVFLVLGIWACSMDIRIWLVTEPVIGDLASGCLLVMGLPVVLSVIYLLIRLCTPEEDSKNSVQAKTKSKRKANKRSSFAPTQVQSEQKSSQPTTGRYVLGLLAMVAIHWIDAKKANTPDALDSQSKVESQADKERSHPEIEPITMGVDSNDDIYLGYHQVARPSEPKY